MSRLLVLFFAFVVAPLSHAALTIEITQGVDNPTSIAVVPFSYSGGDSLTQNIPAVIESDLYRSGQFAPMDQNDMLSYPHMSQDVHYRDWRAVGAEYVLVGRVSKIMGPMSIQVEYELMDVIRQKKILSGTVKGYSDKLRAVAHNISDDVYAQLSGIRGAFSTKILYVAANNVSKGQFRYRMMIADSDGHNEKTIFESSEPMLSPTWSPDGKNVAYVSFESGKAAIYTQNLGTGRRSRLTDFPGINGAPAWSPDGTRMAMVLSKDGNPDIFIMDLDSKKLTRVASHFAIETEPSWTVDGKGIIFTSDRGGKPQIYKANLADGWVERLTFEGDYNARARLVPDGSGLVMIHRRNGKFHVALQQFENGRIRLLSKTDMDESPSIAANGAMLMYATQYRGRGILAAVSIDGSVRYRLPSSSSDVREPAWSPFFDKK
ncbi:MAG: Tol-Pal system beta propeller repeat protein TolB [Pseudomonadales bacterium]